MSQNTGICHRIQAYVTEYRHMSQDIGICQCLKLTSFIKGSTRDQGVPGWLHYRTNKSQNSTMVFLSTKYFSFLIFNHSLCPPPQYKPISHIRLLCALRSLSCNSNYYNYLNVPMTTWNTGHTKLSLFLICTVSIHDVECQRSLLWVTQSTQNVYIYDGYMIMALPIS